MFLSKSSATPLDAKKAGPFPPEFFIRRVLVPEVSMLLIAEDLGLPTSDPKVRITLEASRDFGNAVFPMTEERGIEDRKVKDGKANLKTLVGQTIGNSVPTSNRDQRILRQLPAFIVPYIKSTFNPPAFGNCGFYAIAHSIGAFSENSYSDVRQKLFDELTLHAHDHELLISTPPTRPMKTRSLKTAVSAGAEIVQDLLIRLDHHEVKCSDRYWLRMPYTGFVIASAYDRPIILLDPRQENCNTFFPYRTTPNTQTPMVLAFVDQMHFVALEIKDPSVLPLPDVFGKHRNAAMIETTKIASWIEKYQGRMHAWAELVKTGPSK